ncbi:MAG TPA: hypothetical protein VGR62_00250 [Candidatus Binatia bacterium]|jgi:hypothetical protein|nr:hypothetical protein [Candidatus Binatia bacterium]
MTRRPAIIAAAVLAAFGLTVAIPAADAITVKTRQCVKEARLRLKTRTVDARNAARADFASEFSSCFGPGAECASTCQNEQADCQLPFATNQATAGDVCRSKFDDALDTCRTNVDPQACASVARLTQFACLQLAAAAAAPGLQGCSAEFSDCVGACASAQ